MRKTLLSTCFLLALALTLNSCSREDDLNQSPEKTENVQLLSKNAVIAKLNSLDENTIRKDVPKQYVELTEKKLNSLKNELLNSSKENYTEKELSLLIDKLSEITNDDLNLINKNNLSRSSKSEELINKYADQGWSLNKNGDTYVYQKLVGECLVWININNDEQKQDTFVYHSPARYTKTQILNTDAPTYALHFYPLNSSGAPLTETIASGHVFTFRSVMPVKSRDFTNSMRIIMDGEGGLPRDVRYNSDGTLRNGLNFWDHGMVCVVVQN